MPAPDDVMGEPPPHMPPEASEEVAKAKVKLPPYEPTRKEREEHEGLGCTQYRSWCHHCVKARGIGTQHRADPDEEDGAVPTVCSDYGYLGDEGRKDSVPIIVIRDRKTKGYYATAVQATGMDKAATQFFIGALRNLGWKRYISRSDGEPALVALKTEVAAQMADVEMVPKESPVGDHAANGEAENAVKEVKRQIRAVLSLLEEKLQKNLEPNHPLLAWAPRHAADLLSRYRVGHDGQTAESRRTGKHWRKPLLTFGEKIHFRVVKATEPKSGFTPKMMIGRYCGHHSRTGSIFVMTDTGVYRGKGFCKLPNADRWNNEDLPKLCGVPWDLKRKQPLDVPVLSGQDAVKVPFIVRTQEIAPKGKKLYVLKADIEKFGPTDECQACANMFLDRDPSGKLGRPLGAPHSDECRDRITELLSRDDAGKIRLGIRQDKQDVRDSAGPSGPTGDASSGAGGSASSSAATNTAVLVDASVGAGDPTPDQAAPVSMQVTGASAGSSSGQPMLAGKRAAPTAIDELEGAKGGGADSDVAVVVSTPAAGDPVVQDGMQTDHSTGVNSLDSIQMTSGKFEVLPEVRAQLTQAYRERGMDISNLEVEQIAQVACELGAVDVAEIYSPRRYCKAAPRFGLRPGTSADLMETKPDGTPWDFMKDEDVKEFYAILEEEDPYFLIGTPPCEAFSQLLSISKHTRDPKEIERCTAVGRRHLEVTMGAYESQMRRGRYWLHEHPWGAESWKEPCVERISSMPSVETVKGPMCKWDMMATDPRGLQGEGHVRKNCGWMTNLPRLAELLEGTCSNETGEREWHRHIHLIGGIAKPAQVHPPKLVESVLKSVRDSMIDDGVLSALEITSSGPVPVVHQFADWIECWDDVNGGWLDKKMVEKARDEEVGYMHKHDIYGKVLISEAYENTGKAPIPLLWIDTNKGDDKNPVYRSRIVVMEKRGKGEQGRVLTDAELFSAMPPLEAMRIQASTMVSKKVSKRGKKLKFAVFDISRAHFYEETQRDIYIQLPEAERDGVHCGKLKRNMYGTQDAAARFSSGYSVLMASGGHVAGVSNPAVFHNVTDDSSTLVHGDDFAIVGDQVAIDNLEKLLSSKYELKKIGQLGDDPGDLSELILLNRLCRYDGKTFEIEADPRHAELIISQLGLENAKPVDTPRIKMRAEDLIADERSPALEPSGAKLYRSCTMRGSYLAADRSDLSESIKALAMRMANPRECDMSRLKRVGRYLKGYPRVVQVFKPQRQPKKLDMYVDSDHAGDLDTRRSTVGSACLHGTHCIKHSCNLLSIIGLSSAENEFYGISSGASSGLGIQALMHDMGIVADLVIHTDSSAAKSFCSRRGLGKMKHIQTRFLWVQERLALKHFTLEKVASEKNMADLLTKALSRVRAHYLCGLLGHEFRQGRASGAKAVIGSGN